MMVFRDNRGREWHITLTAGLVREVRQRTELDLSSPLQSTNAFARFLANPCGFADALWVLVEAEAESRQVSEADFLCALDGSALEDAMRAACLAIAELFPRGQIAKALKGRAEAWLRLFDECAVKHYSAEANE